MSEQERGQSVLEDGGIPEAIGSPTLVGWSAATAPLEFVPPTAAADGGDGGSAARFSDGAPAAGESAGVQPNVRAARLPFKVPVLAGVIAVILVIGVAAWALLAGPLRPTVQLPKLKDLTVKEAAAALTPLKLNVAVKDGKVDPSDDEASLWLVSDTEQPNPLHADDTVTLAVRTTLQAAAATCGAGKVEDGGRSLFLDMGGEDYGSGDLAYADVQCVLKELGTPESTLTAMGQTRALDGRQSDEWDGLEASWRYHPDDGLDVIVTFA